MGEGIDELICREPGCGFLLAGGRIHRWRVSSLLKHNRYMDLYRALSAGEPGAAQPDLAVRILRHADTRIFLRIKLLQTLRSPAIHPILGVETINGGRQLYLLSRWEEGGSLASFLQKSPAIPPSLIVSVIGQIADALQLAHEQSMVHGHLKPENCLLVVPATVQVCDFYYAFLGAEAAFSSGPFTAPEQLQGQTEPASDQFALAALAYQLLSYSSQKVQAGSGSQAGRRYENGPYPAYHFPESVFPLSPPLHQVLSRALSERPQARFPDVRTFAHAFSTAMEDSVRFHRRAGSYALTPQERMNNWPVSPHKLSPAQGISGPATPSARMPSRPDRPVVPQNPLRQENLSLRAVQTCLLPGHIAKISALHWTLDGCYLASGSEDGEIRLWSFQSRIGRPLGTLQGQKGKVLALCWSPDQKTLAAALSDSSIRLWKIAVDAIDVIERTQVENAWRGHDGDVTALCWSPDGTILASGGKDGVLRLWDRKGQLLVKRQIHAGKGIKVLAWSPDQHLLATGGADHLIHVWSTFAERQIASWNAHQDEIRRLEWSPQGYLLASAAARKDTRVCIWEAGSGRAISTIEEHRGEIAGLFWSRDASWLATCAAEGVLRFWRTDRLGEGRTVPQLLSFVSIGQVPQLMAGTREASLLAIATQALSIVIFDVNDKVRK
ncbi:MAG: protein kinase [Ktedonobacteraceae bacterium]|nr:protein kinase [Ktedonobacteraceae bacterium]